MVPGAARGLLPGRTPLHADLVLQCQQDQVSNLIKCCSVAAIRIHCAVSCTDARRGHLSTGRCCRVEVWFVYKLGSNDAALQQQEQNMHIENGRGIYDHHRRSKFDMTGSAFYTYVVDKSRAKPHFPCATMPRAGPADHPQHHT